MKKKTPLQSLTERLSAAGINRYQIALIRELITYQVNAIENKRRLREKKYSEARDKVRRKYGIYTMFATTDEQKKKNKVIMTELTKVEKRLMPERYYLSAKKS